jgi:hypothetical protein
MVIKISDKMEQMHLNLSEEQLFAYKYPVGKFIQPDSISQADQQTWTAYLGEFPALLNKVVAGWTEEKWDTPYRPGGWSARQLVHHIADSHAQAMFRIKLALTENEPTIKPYHQDGWGNLSDSLKAPAQWSLNIIEGIHGRWCFMLSQMSAEEWQKTFFHPDMKYLFTIERATALYFWHSRHHLAHLSKMNEK